MSDDSKSAIEDGGDKPLHVAANDADHNEQCVHVITKIFHSIRGQSCWKDFFVELAQCCFDFLFVSETWHQEGTNVSSHTKGITFTLAVVKIMKA